MWEFQLPDGGAKKYSLPVPGCWEMHPELLTYRGTGVYRKEIWTDRNTSYRLIFKGASHTAKVFFDGRLVTEHYNAYTAFEAVIRDVVPGVHELVVEIDNSFHERSSLHVPNDYYSYGGLIRPVVLEELADAYIEGIAFTPIFQEEAWTAQISVTVCSLAMQEQPCRVAGTLAENRLDWGMVMLKPGSRIEVSRRFPIDGVEAWSPVNPRLYELEVQLWDGLGQAFDDLIERVGFRTVAANNGKIQLNGEDIVLKGFNRHEDHPMAGAALPLSLMVHDLELMEAMGANSLRTSHYPNDERFMDLCDERGILVWEENHARGLSLEQMRHPCFIEQCEQVNREMVIQHRNHPSIIIWAILNECASDTEEGRVHYKRQLEQIRGMDNSRLLSFASHHRERELCFDLADIVSFNLYPGWYGDEDPGELCDLARMWADQAGGCGKPMIMSEFGGDGYYGYRDPGRVRGTEERQADIIEANLAAYTKRDYLCGMFIWQFCDCRVTEGTGWLLNRAGTKNCKGIVDSYRRPKLAYDVVRKYFGR
jgi:beta-glucuronidase